MNPIYALQPLRKSIFLAGPTPRKPKPGQSPVPSWRPEALGILEAIGFDGDVFIPEIASWDQHDNYDGQVTWEWEALAQATVIAVWMPREILMVEGDTILGLKMPAFTTDMEFALYAPSGKIMLGFPEGAEKMKYPIALARRFNAPVHENTTLSAFMAAAVERAQTLYSDCAIR